MRSEEMTPRFVWASAEPSPPGRWDLRMLGWSMIRPEDLVENHDDADAGDKTGDGASEGDESANAAGSANRKRAADLIPWLVDCREASQSHDHKGAARPELVAIIGADDPQQRAEILAEGVGEALPSHTAVVELGARMTRLVANLNSIPRVRRAGPVTLDLFHRDGKIAERWLGLHPREFSLLWRLAETPGERVTRRELLMDVWRLDHMPETNSLEVHVSRLRAKLAISQAAWVVETDPHGGYRLGRNSSTSFFAFSKARQEALDTEGSIGDDRNNDSLTVSVRDADK
jgi:DNA-binding response OmpR family regulator